MSANIVLASASPRRREILETAGLEFEVLVSNVDETVAPGTPPDAAAALTARKKALAVKPLRPDSLIIGADTTVVLDGTVMGKPKDKEQAKEMLRALSGRVHSVFTGVCLIYGSREVAFVQKTDVSFYPLSEEEIAEYVESGEPMDKAGAYGIQGRGCALVRGIEGDYFNVVGLPAARVMREIKRLIF